MVNRKNIACIRADICNSSEIWNLAAFYFIRLYSLFNIDLYLNNKNFPLINR